MFLLQLMVIAYFLIRFDLLSLIYPICVAYLLVLAITDYILSKRRAEKIYLVFIISILFFGIGLLFYYKHYYTNSLFLFFALSLVIIFLSVSVFSGRINRNAVILSINYILVYGYFCYSIGNFDFLHYFYEKELVENMSGSDLDSIRNILSRNRHILISDTSDIQLVFKLKSQIIERLSSMRFVEGISDEDVTKLDTIEKIIYTKIDSHLSEQEIFKIDSILGKMKIEY